MYGHASFGAFQNEASDCQEQGKSEGDRQLQKDDGGNQERL